MAIIQTEASLYLWVGKQLPEANMEPYRNAAMAHMAKLAQHERASNEPIVVNQDKEDVSFWEAFGLGERPAQPYTTEEFSNLYIDVSIALIFSRSQSL